jgi:hypothetical protein
VVAFLMELPRHDARASAVVSLLVHAALVTGAVVATIQTRGVPASRRPVVPIVWMVPPTRAPAAPLSGLGSMPTPVPPQLIVPQTVPAVIPAPSTAPFDPSRFGIESSVPAVSGRTPLDTVPAGAVYVERWVEEPPELITHPAAHFPDVLRQAGIGGRALVEAVIDTTGHAEAGSMTVVDATNPLFEAPARAVVAGSEYRPGRVSGHPVRVRIRVAVVFRLEGSDARR